MNTYQRYSNKVIGFTFILAPVLLIAGVLAFLLGIGIGPFGITSWVEGLLHAFAYLLLIPIYLKLAEILGRKAPRLAIVSAVFSLGIGVAILPSNSRMLVHGLERAGYTIPVFSLDIPGFPYLFIYFALSILASIMLGIGFLRYGGISRISAICLILAPIVLIIGQGGDETIALWRVQIVYPLATVLWFVALAPIGWRLLNGSADDGVEVGGVQTAV